MDPLSFVQAALVVLAVAALAVLALGLTIVVQLRLAEHARAVIQASGAGMAAGPADDPSAGPDPLGEAWLDETLAVTAADDPDALGLALWRLDAMQTRQEDR